jgi:hypothetical protein
VNDFDALFARIARCFIVSIELAVQAVLGSKEGELFGGVKIDLALEPGLRY